MTDTTVQLGTFVFQDMEIPEYINFGGEQQLVQHNLIGGNRIIDILGKNDDDISWKGLMTGPQALNRAIQLNQLRVNGGTLPLSLFTLNFNVVILSLKAYIERYYQVRYEITLKVVTDNITPIQVNTPTGFNSAVNSDIASINVLSNSINIPSVTNAINNVNTAYSNAVNNTTSTTTSTNTNTSSTTNTTSTTQQPVVVNNTQSLLNASPQNISALTTALTTALNVVNGGPASVITSVLLRLTGNAT
jgi:hypothetical protein